MFYIILSQKTKEQKGEFPSHSLQLSNSRSISNINLIITRPFVFQFKTISNYTY